MAMMQHDREVVTRALTSMEDLPADTRQMLVGGVPHLNPKYGVAQTVIQVELTRLAREALGSARRLAAEGVTACRSGAEAADAALETRRAACAEADQARVAALAEAAARHEEAAARSSAVVAAEANCVGAERLRADLAQKRSELQGARARASGVCEGPVRMLREGGWDDEEVRDASLDATLQYMRETNAEKGLTASAAIALRLKPEARGIFDRVAIDSVAEFLEETIAGIDSSLAAGEAETRDASGEALGLWALADVARDAERAALTASAAAASKAQAAAATQTELWGTQGALEATRDAALREQALAEEGAQAAELVLASLERLAVGYPEAAPVAEAAAADDDVAMEQVGAAPGAVAEPTDPASTEDVVMGEADLAKASVVQEVPLEAAAQMGA